MVVGATLSPRRIVHASIGCREVEMISSMVFLVSDQDSFVQGWIDTSMPATLFRSAARHATRHAGQHTLHIL